MVYRWKELELFTIQTISNIITLIQFALAPFELINPESEFGNEDLILELNQKFGSIIKFFSSPLNLIRKYNNIIGPIRTMLSALIFNAVILFLYSIFFLPSWRFIIFFLDIFIPGCFLFGIIFISRKYDEQKKIALILIIIGIIYLLFRITFFILNLLKRKNLKWYLNCAHRISSVFLSRLKGHFDFQDETTEDIGYQIDKNTSFIQFDDFHFTYKKRIIDFIITFIIWLFLLIFVIFGLKKILQKNFDGKQLEDISLITNIITYSLFSGICLRLIINIIWLIKPIENKIFSIFKILHKLAYKGIQFLAGIFLIPILGMALKSSVNISYRCGHYNYFDTKSNADSFIQNFMKSELSYCQRCTLQSINTNPICNNVCSLNYSEQSEIFYAVLESKLFSDHFTELYFIPILIFDIFYLSLFIFSLRFISKITLDVLVILPAPTINIECKFQTLINTLNSASLNIFRSYRFKNALYSFSLTEAKLFVFFWTNLTFCGILPIPYDWDPIFLCFIVSFTSFFIAESQLFMEPYISILHNIVNFFSYSVSGISSFLVGLHVCRLFVMPQQLAIFLVVMIIATPILTALITPFFAKKDPLLVPTKFDLLRIQKWDKKLTQVINFRKMQLKAKKERKKQKKLNEDLVQNEDDLHFDNGGILLDDEPSVSVSYFQNKENEREHDFLVSNFDLIKLAPIQIQEKLNKNDNDDEFTENVEKLWPKSNINDECFDNATNEMINSSNRLIDCLCYTNLIRLFNFSLIFSSACLGWCLSSGIERWQKVLSPQGYKYYLRCNMLANGSFPAFGTY